MPRPLDQRHQQQRQPGADQRHARPVQGRALRCARFGDVACRRDGEQADRDVDEKDAAPAQPEQVGMHQPSAQHLPGDGGQAQRHPQQAEGAAAVVAAEVDTDGGIDLREQQGGRQPLQHPRTDQEASAGRQPAQGRSHSEARHADDEQAAAPEQVAQPPAGNQQHAEGQLVAGHDKADLREARTQPGLHAGDGDIHHEQVEDRDETGQQQHGQAEPARAADGARRRHRKAGI